MLPIFLVVLRLLFLASFPHLHLHRLRPNLEPFLFVKVLTCMDAVSSCRCLPKSPTPLRLRLHPHKVCVHFNSGSLPPIQVFSCLIVAFLLVNQARFKLVRQCCFLCRKLIYFFGIFEFCELQTWFQWCFAPSYSSSSHWSTPCTSHLWPSSFSFAWAM